MLFAQETLVTFSTLQHGVSSPFYLILVVRKLPCTATTYNAKNF